MTAMASFRKKGKVWYFRFVNADGVKRELKGCPDRRVTEEMARAAESEAAKVRAGLVDPKSEGFLRAERRPLGEHLEDFRDYLMSKGDAPRYVHIVHAHVARIIALTKANRISDLTSSSVQGAIKALRDSDLSLQTCNHALRAVKSFSRWLVRDRRAREDALAELAGYNVKEDRRHDRRTLGVDDLRRVIEAAHQGEPYLQMSGPDRALCYRLAVATGMRYSEIRSLQPGSFALGSAAPTATVRAAYTKDGEPATLDLPRDLADDLASWLVGRSVGSPAFPLPEKGAKMLRVDLAAAGIPYRDAAGLVFDFHALRCQHATLLDQAGVTPRVVQRKMRHSTLELTDRYTRPRAVDLRNAAAALPCLRPESDGGEAARATGTDGPDMSNRFSPHLPTGGDGTGRGVAVAGGIADSSPSMSMDRNSQAVAGVCASGRAVAATGGKYTRQDSNLQPSVPKAGWGIAEKARKPLGLLDLNPIGSFCKGLYPHARNRVLS
jgi:integrase